MVVKFRKGKDKEGNVYTYPIDTERKSKKSKPATKPSPKRRDRKIALASAESVARATARRSAKIEAEAVARKEAEAEARRIIAKTSKPASKPKKSSAVKYAEKYINIIEDITPLGSINKHTTYISDKSAYEQSEEAIDMIKFALKGSKIARNKRPAKKPKLTDEEINELYMEFNA